jgi:BTB/POZ domain-containing protein
MPNVDIILQLLDLIDFCVHKSALVASSPLFDDMFTLPQPPDNTSPDKLLVVHLSEDAEVLNSLVSMLYPVPPEMPYTINKILALLAATEKYDMSVVLSSIHMEIDQRGLLSSTPADVFHVYAIVCNRGLVPEMASLAHLSLGHPLTFKTLGDVLWCFKGWALHELANFCQHSIDNFSLNLESFSNCIKGPSKIWMGCSETKVGGGAHLPFWLERCFWSEWGMSKWLDFILMDDRFAQTIPTAVELCNEYLNALQSHVKDKDCHFCLRVHALEGEKYCEELKKVSTEVWDILTPMLERNMGL